MKKMFMVATVPGFFNFFKGQLKYLSGHLDITLISSSEDALHEIAAREGVSALEVRIERSISPLCDLVSLWKLIRLFRRENPDIVHGNTPKGALVSMVAARLCGIPRRIYMCHGLRYQGSQGVMRQLLMTMEWIACRCATEVICVSESVRRAMSDDGICRMDKMRVVMSGSCNGINTEYFYKEAVADKTVREFRNKTGIPEPAFVFCFVGRITRDKGMIELLEVFDKIYHRHDDVWLLIVGGREDDVKDFPSRTLEIMENHPHTVCTGRLSDIRPALAVTDVFILPSYREGLPTSILEAASMATSTIATDITGCRDAVDDGVTGILVAPRRKRELQEAMERLHTDRNLCEKMGRNARSYVMRRYSQNRLWNAYLQIYNSQNP